MDNFMDRLVERMNTQDRGFDGDGQGSYGGRRGGYDSRSGGRMDYPEDDGFGYGRQSGGSSSGVGRKDLEELGRAIISAQKKIADDQGDRLSDSARTMDALKGAIVDQAKGLDAGFKEQDRKIDDSTDRLMQAIKEVGADVRTAPTPQAAAPAQDSVSRSYIEELIGRSAEDIKAKSAEDIHKENVKLYKNVQAIVEENASRVADTLSSSKKSGDDLAASLAPLSQLEKINELEAALAETKEELVNRTSGLKAKITVNLILAIINFAGVAVLVAIAFGFL